MAKQRLLSGATANGNGPVCTRPSARIFQNKFMWKKTGSGTVTINLVDVDTGVVLATDNISTGAQTGTHDLFASDQVQAQLASVSGSVVVDAWLDGWS